MKAAVLYDKHQSLVIEELTLEAPREREVRVKLTSSGVCHSDLHYMKGEREHPMPVVLGHEGAGRVEELGPGVTIPISQSTTKTSVLVGSGIGRADRERSYFLAASACRPTS